MIPHWNLICVFGTFVRYSYNMIPVCCLLHLFFFNVNRPPNLALVPSSPQPCNLVVAAVPKPTKSIIFALDYVWPMSTCMYPRLFNLSRFTCISLYICSYISRGISTSNDLSLASSSLVPSILLYCDPVFFFLVCPSFSFYLYAGSCPHTEEHILPRPILSIVAGMLPWLIVSWPFRSLPCVILFSFTSSHPISVSLTVDFLVSPFRVLSDLKSSYPGLSYLILSYFLLPWLVSFTQNVSPTVRCIGMPPEQPIQSQSVKNRGAEVFRFLFGGEEWIFVHGCTWRWKGFRWRVTKHLSHSLTATKNAPTAQEHKMKLWHQKTAP